MPLWRELGAEEVSRVSLAISCSRTFAYSVRSVLQRGTQTSPHLGAFCDHLLFLLKHTSPVFSSFPAYLMEHGLSSIPLPSPPYTLPRYPVRNRGVILPAPGNCQTLTLSQRLVKNDKMAQSLAGG